MERRKNLLQPINHSPQNSQTLRLFRRYDDTFRQRDKFSEEPSFKMSKLSSSLQKISRQEKIFLKESIKRKLKHTSFEKDSPEQITEYFITNHLQGKRDRENFGQKFVSGLKPLFKIKKRKLCIRKLEKSYSEDIEIAQILKNSYLDEQRSRKSPTKGIMETSFYKNYKSSIQKKKQREKGKIKLSANNQHDNGPLVKKMQHFQILKKHSLK